jgi:hypothetical protein
MYQVSSQSLLRFLRLRYLKIDQSEISKSEDKWCTFGDKLLRDIVAMADQKFILTDLLKTSPGSMKTR